MKQTKSLLLTACFVLMGFFAQAQDINAAIELFNNGAKAAQENDFPTAIENLTKAMEAAQALGEAEGAAKIVADVKNLVPSLHLGYASQLAKDNAFDQALEQCNLAIETSKKFDDINNTAASAGEMLNNLYLQIANQAFNAKEYDKAKEYYNKVLEAQPENGTATLRLGLSEMNSGNTEAAEALLEKAAGLGQEATANKTLGTLFLKQALAAQKEKKWAACLEAAQKAIAKAPNANGYKLAGTAALELKKYKEAAEAWGALREADPNAKDINTTLFRLATCYEGLNNKAEACKLYKALISDPKFKEMAEYKIKTQLKCE